jgi:hypothetical protein
MTGPGHMEDCGWCDDVPDDDDADPREELPYDGPMPECGDDYDDE